MAICCTTNVYFIRYSPIQCSLTCICIGIMCVQVFASDFGLVGMYPMRTKGEAHEALSQMFWHEGIPPSMVVDGTKEQTLGQFFQKLVDDHFVLKQTELYSPWQNAAESNIKELKKSC